MPSPLIDNMIEQHGYPMLDETAIESFINEHPLSVLFFTEDPARFPESNDVAMILPELVSHFGNRFKAAVVAQSAQRKLQTRFGFNEWPSLVFLRDGRYIGTISRVQDWVTYLQLIEKILDAEPALAPGFAVPVEQSSSACNGCQEA